MNFGQQMQKQNDLINELKNSQSFADHMTDRFADEQIMNMMQEQINDLKKKVDGNSK